MAAYKPVVVQVVPRLGERITQDTVYWRGYKVGSRRSGSAVPGQRVAFSGHACGRGSAAGSVRVRQILLRLSVSTDPSAALRNRAALKCRPNRPKVVCVVHVCMLVYSKYAET